MPPEEPHPPAAELPGQPSWISPVQPVVPDHELLRRIGGGSYGDVWLARSVVGTWRAVKVVFRDRFLDARPYEREFRGIQKFEPLSRSNEGFIDILQIGRNDAEGYFYYVMELADDAAPVPPSDPGAASGSPAGTPESRQPQPGFDPETYVPRTLAKALLQRGRLPLGECLELGITLNLALAHLHRAGLIHRDIKPSNLIFVGGVPKLADIGLVIEVAEARSYVGTEGFIPPEGPNSPQADLYSLGKVLYEAGMGKDRKDFPEPPTLMADVPDSAELLEFNAILLRACAANVKDRYHSAEAMNADLALLQSGGSVRRQRKLAGQLRFVQRAGALVTVLAAVIAAGWFWQARETRLVRVLSREKGKLAEENRERMVHLEVANGVRLMDHGDYSGALLWLAEALPLVTNNPAEESIHRIRIQQLLNQSPKLVQVMNHDNWDCAGALSPDGRRLASVGNGKLCIWEPISGRLLVGPLSCTTADGVRYSQDGTRLLLGGNDDSSVETSASSPQSAMVTDALTGQERWPAVTNVLWAAFSPDDRWLAVTHPGTNCAVEVYDSSTGHLIVELRGHTDEIKGICFSQDGRFLATASEDKTARVWNLPSGDLVGRPMLHDYPVLKVAFSPDAQRLATADATELGEWRGLVHTWDALTSREIGSPIRIARRAFGLTFQKRNGQRLLAGDGEGTVMVLEAETHSPVYPGLALENDVLTCWAFSPDGLRLATGDRGGSARVWDLETGEALTPLLQHSDGVRSVHFGPDGDRLITTSNEGVIKLWDLAATAQGMRQMKIPGNCRAIDGFWGSKAELSRDGTHLLLASGSAKMQLVNLDKLSPEGLPMVSSDGSAIETITFDASGHQWASCADENSPVSNSTNWIVDLWREAGGKLRRFALPHPHPVGVTKFSQDGQRLWTYGKDLYLRTWQTADGKLLDEKVATDAQHTAMCGMSADGKSAVLFRGTDNDYATDPHVFDLRRSPATGKRLEGYEAAAWASFSPDGTRVAEVLASEGWICDAATGNSLFLPFRHGGKLTNVRWSPDGREVLTFGSPRNIKLWNAATGVLAHPPMEFGRSTIEWASYSPDGRFVFAHDLAGWLRVWDAKTSEPVTPIFHHAERVNLSAMTGTNRLLSISYPNRFAPGDPNAVNLNIIRVWELQETKLPVATIAEYARLLAGRKLGPQGVFQTLDGHELAALYQSLRTNRPALFVTPD